MVSVRITILSNYKTLLNVQCSYKAKTVYVYNEPMWASRYLFLLRWSILWTTYTHPVVSPTFTFKTRLTSTTAVCAVLACFYLYRNLFSLHRNDKRRPRRGSIGTVWRAVWTCGGRVDLDGAWRSNLIQILFIRQQTSRGRSGTL